MAFKTSVRLKCLRIGINKLSPAQLSQDWNTMFKYLEEKNNTRKLWSIIDDAVEKLGLKFEDWIVLKETSSFILYSTLDH